MKITLDLLKYEVPNKLVNGERCLFDEVRKKWIKVTPEELVRQHFIQYLLKEKNYPAALMKIEHPLTLNDLKKRSDIVVYSRAGKPWLLVECKAPQIPLKQDVMNQAARYNTMLGVEYLIITNGVETMAAQYTNNNTQYAFITAIPAYPV